MYSNADIRNLMTVVFGGNEERFEFFVEDHFEEVLGRFEASATFGRKTQELAKYCREYNLTGKLVLLISRDFPDKFKESGLPAPEVETAEAAAQAETVETAEPPTLAESKPASTSQTPAPVANDEASLDQPQNLDVFISYSRRDETFIKQLYNALISKGISTWYDRHNIRVGKHWPSEIVEGIQNCKVFLLSVSPDSTASDNVRKEVDLAQRYDKQIVPLIWRKAKIPVVMEYQLAGIQWIEFNEEISEEKFGQLNDVLRSLLGGATLDEAGSNKPIVIEAPIPPLEQKQPKKVGGGKKLGGLKRKTKVSPLAVGGLVIAGVVTTFELEDTADDEDGVSEKDYVNNELDWLFKAADHLLQLRNGDISLDQPVPVTIPPDAKTTSTDNKILNASFPPVYAKQVETIFGRIKNQLGNLDLVLKREAQLGEDALTDLGLQAEIRGDRHAIVEDLVTLASLMEQAYGVLVTTPGQLLQLLEE